MRIRCAALEDETAPGTTTSMSLKGGVSLTAIDSPVDSSCPWYTPIFSIACGTPYLQALSQLGVVVDRLNGRLGFTCS